MILFLDTFSRLLNVAIGRPGEVIDAVSMDMKLRHSEQIFPVISAMLKQNHLAPSDLSAIGFISGPGSFTGLRIGGSVAKGLAFSLEIPLYTLSTFDAMAWMIKKKMSLSTGFGLLIDARIQQFYGQVFWEKKVTSPVCQPLTEWHSQYPEIKTWVAETDHQLPPKENYTYIHFLSENSIQNLAEAGLEMIALTPYSNPIEGADEFEPDYIQDFIVKQNR